MGLFGERAAYDRRRLIGEAREAQRKGKHKRAVARLRRILLVEPECTEIHAAIAPSLAYCKETFEAWECYGKAVNGLLAEGRKQPALDLYRNATERMPRHYPAWKARAMLERKLGRTKEAEETLEASLVHFRGRKQRGERIALLRLWVELSPKAADRQVALAAALAKAGRKHEALHRLTELAKQVEPAMLKRIRRCQWEIEPSLSHSWLWLRSAFVR